jgi:hypothetical protein
MGGLAEVFGPVQRRTGDLALAGAPCLVLLRTVGPVQQRLLMRAARVRACAGFSPAAARRFGTSSTPGRLPTCRVQVRTAGPWPRRGHGRSLRQLVQRPVVPYSSPKPPGTQRPTPVLASRCPSAQTTKARLHFVSDSDIATGNSASSRVILPCQLGWYSEGVKISAEPESRHASLRAVHHNSRHDHGPQPRCAHNQGQPDERS